MPSRGLGFIITICFLTIFSFSAHAQMPAVDSACPTGSNAGSFALGDIGSGEIALLVCDADDGNYRTFISKTGTGPLRAGSYGSGTYSGTPTYLLAVEADGDIMEINVASLAGDDKAIDDLTDAAKSVSYNTLFLGHDGGSAGANDTFNTAIGTTALDALDNSTATGNVAIGHDVLTANDEGDYNVGVGYGALSANSSGGGNVAVGYGALLANTTGVSNVGIGGAALVANTAGYRNVALGEGAMESNIAKHNNVAIGYGANRYGNDDPTPALAYNTAVGVAALKGSGTASNNTGIENTALGGESLENYTSGSNNVGLGYGVGASLASQSRNILVGGSGVDTDGTDDYLNIGNALYGDMGTSTATGSNDADITVDGSMTVSNNLTASNEVDFTSYGSGTHTGTATQNLAVDASGNVIETSLGGGGGLTPTSIKTTSYTANAGEQVLVDLSGGALTVTAPSSPSPGDEFGSVIVGESLSNLTIDFGAENYNGYGGKSEFYSAVGSNASYKYVNASVGWIRISSERQRQGPGEARFATANSHTLTLPIDIGAVHVLCVGAGGAGGNVAIDDTEGGDGGGGGGVGWINEYPISTTEALTGVSLYVGKGGSSDGEDSYFISSSICRGGGGKRGADAHESCGWGCTLSDGGDYTGEGGMTGEAGTTGSSDYGGGGGGGGAGNGGLGRNGNYSGSGYDYGGGGGGGTGFLWAATTGSNGSTPGEGGQGGSGGNDGADGKRVSGNYGNDGGDGGLYGAGGGGAASGSYDTTGAESGGKGAQGFIRVIWGEGRAFPSTNTGAIGTVVTY